MIFLKLVIKELIETFPFCLFFFFFLSILLFLYLFPFIEFSSSVHYIFNTLSCSHCNRCYSYLYYPLIYILFLPFRPFCIISFFHISFLLFSHLSASYPDLLYLLLSKICSLDPCLFPSVYFSYLFIGHFYIYNIL